MSEVYNYSTNEAESRSTGTIWREPSTHLPVNQADYDRLRQIASTLLRRERQGHPLQSDDLVNEALMRILGSRKTISFHDWDHLRRVVRGAMRRALIDHARSEWAAKRGARAVCVPIQPNALAVDNCTRERIIFAQAFGRLRKRNRRQSRIVEMRVFLSLPIEEIARELSVSTRTIKRDWKEACMFLCQELGLAARPSATPRPSAYKRPIKPTCRPPLDI